MTVTVQLDKTLRRYEIRVSGHLAGFTEFTDRGSVRTFCRTSIDPEFAGSGLGSQLISAALDAERAARHQIRAKCPFVRRFIERQPQYEDLLAATERKSA